MQQGTVYPDLTSPFMVWQYFHLMTPSKTSADYALHPAFVPTTSLTAPPAGYLQEQYVSNVNYQLQQQQQQQYFHQSYCHQQQHLGKELHHDEYQPVPNVTGKNDNHSRSKRVDKILTDSNANHKTTPNKMASSHNVFTNRKPLNPASSKKKPSFTIDSILNKDEDTKTSGEISNRLMDSIGFLESVCTPLKSISSTPPTLAPCSPSNERLGIPPPLMHSTPQSYESSTAERRHNRFLEVSHPYYFQQQYDNPHAHLHHPQVPPETPLASSSSPSISSSGLSSVSSSYSTSPESTAAPRNDKAERKAGGKAKRIRTIFTPEQLERLEAEFERQQYMVGTERYYLAASLNLTEAQVKVWFQNRRIKWRKQHLEQQQARLAQGDLYRDLEDDDSEESDMEDQAAIVARRAETVASYDGTEGGEGISL